MKKTVSKKSYVNISKATDENDEQQFLVKEFEEQTIIIEKSSNVFTESELQEFLMKFEGQEMSVETTTQLNLDKEINN